MARSKQQIIECILNLLLELENESDAPDTVSKPLEMLTIKECTELVKGLTSNTIRKLIARGELECVRAGCGTNGKILIPKANIIALCSNQQRM